jgi:hypothetical protein
MTINLKPAESRVRLAAPELPAGIRSGGENVPLEYPHLYQVQAGDWRISYAVEHNRLAILVLEVLNPDGTSSKDAGRQNLTRKMKIKLLDWPEGAGGREAPPEVVTNKMKIKWLDMAEDAERGEAEDAQGKPRIKFRDEIEKPGELKRTATNRITLLDSGEVVEDDEPEEADPPSEAVEQQERKVTPLDRPTM